jgi:hypothetical protein
MPSRWDVGSATGAENRVVASDVFQVFMQTIGREGRLEVRFDTSV